MSQQSASFNHHQTPRIAGIPYSTLWTADAVAWLVLGAGDIFAAPQVVDLFGLSEGATPYLRVMGIVFVGYALFQFWVARSGSVPRWAYFLMSIETAIWGVALIAIPFVGVEMNDVGKAACIAGGLSFLLVAELWYLARQHS